ncbi:MAG: protease modulator HflC [Rhodospirillales bacterium]|nr:protease modulator HflC [Rhodospirillales bacterium]
MKAPLVVILAVLVVAAMAAIGSTFRVTQWEQALVLQLGEPIREHREPGLKFKIPFVQNVVFFDKRVLDLDPPSEEVMLSDQKRIIVDAFARYRITNPLRFYQSVRDEVGLRNIVGQQLNASVRNIVGLNSLDDILSSHRDAIMERVQSEVNQVAGTRFGIEIVDVRVNRADLPEQISNNVYDRMRSEREREANLLRAEGDQIKATITAEADRERIVILAEANRAAQVLRGEGDGERNRLLAAAFGKDPKFFAFYRSINAYRTSLTGSDTTFVLSPNSDFFRFFGDLSGVPAKK